MRIILTLLKYGQHCHVCKAYYPVFTTFVKQSKYYQVHNIEDYIEYKNMLLLSYSTNIYSESKIDQEELLDIQKIRH